MEVPVFQVRRWLIIVTDALKVIRQQTTNTFLSFSFAKKKTGELDFGLRRNHQDTMDIQPIDGNKFPLCILLSFQIHPKRLPGDSSRRGPMKANANIPNRNGFLPQWDILIRLCVVACGI
jgi:hypothetical protein